MASPADSSSEKAPTSVKENVGVEPPAKKGWRFWAVFSSLCMATWLVAVESTVVSTDLPVITREVNAGDSFVWILNVYLLTR